MCSGRFGQSQHMVKVMKQAEAVTAAQRHGMDSKVSSLALFRRNKNQEPAEGNRKGFLLGIFTFFSQIPLDQGLQLAMLFSFFNSFSRQTGHKGRDVQGVLEQVTSWSNAVTVHESSSAGCLRLIVPRRKALEGAATVKANRA